MRHRGGDGRSGVLRLYLVLEEIASSSLASYNTIIFRTWAVHYIYKNSKKKLKLEKETKNGIAVKRHEKQ